MSWEQGEWLLAAAWVTFLAFDCTLYVLFWEWRDRRLRHLFLPWSGFRAALNCRKAHTEQFRENLGKQLESLAPGQGKVLTLSPDRRQYVVLDREDLEEICRRANLGLKDGCEPVFQWSPKQ